MMKLVPSAAAAVVTALANVEHALRARGAGSQFDPPGTRRVNGGRRRRAAGCLLALAASVLVVPLAHAGGDFVDIAAAGAQVWFVGEPGVRQLDARTGRALAIPQVPGAYPLSVAIGGGAVWVASVENGYVQGQLTRIDLRSRRARVVWRQGDGSVQYVAAGPDAVWALIGAPGGDTIARFDLDGRLVHRWKIADAGRMAADASGCWISTDNWLLHIDPAGKLHHVVRAQLGDIATGAGAAWLPQTATILRVDEQTGAIRPLHTARLHLGGFQHDLAAGAAALWVLDDTGRGHSALDRLDPASGRTTGRVALTGIADAIALTPTAVWVATVIAPPNRPATGYDVIRINPATLQHKLLAHIV